MFETLSTVIDKELCTGCGLCVQTCPVQALSIRDGKAAVTGSFSLNCGHCMAVCPAGAIKVGTLESSMSQFKTFAADDPLAFVWRVRHDTIGWTHGIETIVPQFFRHTCGQAHS